MVRQRWVPKAELTNQDSREDCATVKEDRSEQLLRWLIGTWRDQRGSTYALSVDVDGTVSVETTRPSGEVILTVGLIRADSAKGGRVVWGKAGGRFQYVLDKLNDQQLRWQSGTAAPFHWERQEEDEEEPEAELEAYAEQSERGRKCAGRGRNEVGERRAQLRREFKEQRQQQRQQVEADALSRALPTGDEKPGEDVGEDFEKLDSRGSRGRRVRGGGAGISVGERQVESLDDKSETLKQLLGLNAKDHKAQNAGKPPKSREASDLLQLLCGGEAAHTAAQPWAAQPPSALHGRQREHSPHQLQPQAAWAHEAAWAHQAHTDPQPPPGQLEYYAYLRNLALPHQQYEATAAPTQPTWGNMEDMMPTEL